MAPWSVVMLRTAGVSAAFNTRRSLCGMPPSSPPFRSVSSPPLPPDQPLHRVSLRGRVASLMALRGEPKCWPPVFESRSSISATSLQRTRILGTSVKSLPMGTSANTCARLNGCNSVNSRQLSCAVPEWQPQRRSQSVREQKKKQ